MSAGKYVLEFPDVILAEYTQRFDDFGDSIRFGASTALEDEKDLSKVEMSLDLYRAYCDGFLPACPDLTVEEIRSLPYGAKIITLKRRG